MSKTLSCREVGMDCNFVVKGDSEEQILSQAAEHARTEHNMNEIPAELLDRVKSLIRDDEAA